jgi:hypothetical protein
MKRFITFLALLLIGVTSMAAEKPDYKQINAPPDGTCVDLAITISQPALAVDQVYIVSCVSDDAVNFHFVASVEASSADRIAVSEFYPPPDVSMYAIDPAPDNLYNLFSHSRDWLLNRSERFCNLPATANYSYNLHSQNRAWLIHRMDLERKMNFLYPAVRDLPVPFA